MTSVLMHTCCAPCSLSCIDPLRAEGIEPVAFWYNPNIHPWKEYEARRDCLLSKHNINVDLILQSIGREDSKDISFTVHEKDLEDARAILTENQEVLCFDHIEVDGNIGKVSIVGAGLMTNCGMAARMFEALYEAGINIQMINTSEIRVSVLLDEGDVDRAVRAIHAKFFDEI